MKEIKLNFLFSIDTFNNYERDKFNFDISVFFGDNDWSVFNDLQLLIGEKKLLWKR
jgi:hypothetical protein